MKTKVLLWLATILAVSLCHAQNSARMLSGVNAQTGTSYTFVPKDATRLTTFANANPVAGTLPSGLTFGFGKGTEFSIQNLGPAPVTVTCSGCLIYSTTPAGDATLTLQAGAGADLYSDGRNYAAVLGGGTGGGGGIGTLTGITTDGTSGLTGGGLFGTLNMAIAPCPVGQVQTSTGSGWNCAPSGSATAGGSPNNVQINSGGTFGGVGLAAGQLLVGTSGAPIAQTKLTIDARDAGVDCTGATDPSAALNAITNNAGFNGKTLIFPVGCSLNLANTWTIKNASAFKIQGASQAGAAGILNNGVPTLKWTGAIGGTMLDMEYVDGFTVENLSFDGNSRAYLGINVDKTGGGGTTNTTDGIFRRLFMQGNDTGTNWVGISFSPVSTNNVEDMRVLDSTFFCGGSATKGAAALLIGFSPNAKNYQFLHNEIHDCAVGVWQKTGGMDLEYTEFGDNTLDVRIDGWSDPNEHIDNNLGESAAAGQQFLSITAAASPHPLTINGNNIPYNTTCAVELSNSNVEFRNNSFYAGSGHTGAKVCNTNGAGNGVNFLASNNRNLTDVDIGNLILAQNRPNLIDAFIYGGLKESTAGIYTPLSTNALFLDSIRGIQSGQSVNGLSFLTSVQASLPCAINSWCGMEGGMEVAGLVTPNGLTATATGGSGTNYGFYVSAIDGSGNETLLRGGAPYLQVSGPASLNGTSQYLTIAGLGSPGAASCNVYAVNIFNALFVNQIATGVSCAANWSYQVNSYPVSFPITTLQSPFNKTLSFLFRGKEMDLQYGMLLKGYSDKGSTLKWSINSATGFFTGLGMSQTFATNPTEIDLTIGSTAYQKLTSAKNEFIGAVQFDSTIATPLAAGCAKIDVGGALDTTNAACLSYPAATGTEFVTSNAGTAWGASVPGAGSGDKVATVDSANYSGDGAGVCLKTGSSTLTTSGCTSGTGNISNSGSPTNGQMAQFTSATQIQGINTTGSGSAVLATSPSISAPTITSHPVIEGVTSTGATGTGKFVFDASPTLSGHPTIEGVTSTGATGTGKFVFDTSPTIATATLSGHPTVEGVTSTGATGTGKFVFDTSPTISAPTISGHPTIEGVTSTGGLGTGAFVFSATPAAGQALVGNAGGTAFAPVSIGTDATLSSAGALTVTGLRAKALPSLPGTQSFLGYSGAAWNFTTLATMFTAPTFTGGVTAAGGLELTTGHFKSDADAGASIQCAHFDTSGQLLPAGNGDCGSGGGSGTVNNGTNTGGVGPVGYWAATGTAISPHPTVGLDAAGNITGLASVSSGTSSGLCGNNTGCLEVGAGPIGTASGTGKTAGGLIVDSATNLWNVILPNANSIVSAMNYAVSSTTVAGAPVDTKVMSASTISGSAGTGVCLDANQGLTTSGCGSAGTFAGLTPGTNVSTTPFAVVPGSVVGGTTPNFTFTGPASDTNTGAVVSIGTGASSTQPPFYVGIQGANDVIKVNALTSNSQQLAFGACGTAAGSGTEVARQVSCSSSNVVTTRIHSASTAPFTGTTLQLQGQQASGTGWKLLSGRAGVASTGDIGSGAEVFNVLGNGAATFASVNGNTITGTSNINTDNLVTSTITPTANYLAVFGGTTKVVTPTQLLPTAAVPAMTGGDVTGSNGSLVLNINQFKGAAIPTSANGVSTNGSQQLVASTAHNTAVPLTCADSSASDSASTCTTAPSFTPASGDCVIYTSTTALSGTSRTLAVNGAAAKPLAKWQATTTLAANDILANKRVLTCYDGTNWELDNTGNGGAVTSVNSLSGAVVIEAATAGQMAVSGGSGAALTGAADMTYSTHTFATTTAGIFDWSAATGAGAFKLPPVVGGTSLAGTSTGNLSAPIVIQNTNSTNNNTSITMGVTAPGTSTGQTVLNVNGASTGGDLVDFGTGGAWASGVLSGQTITHAFTPTGQIKTGTAPTVTTPGSGYYVFGTDGTEPASIGAGTSGFVMDSTGNCPIQWNNAANVGCSAALGAAESFTAAQTFTGGIVNTTTPIRDQTRFVLVSNMTAVATAGVNIGSTGAGNATFSWPVTAANWYDMRCKFPVTFAASATVKFQLVSISGSVTVSNVNSDTLGNTGASAAFQDLATIGGTTLATSATPVTGAPAASEMITYSSQFLTSHAGNIGIEFIANGTNNITMLLGGECQLTQIN